MTIEAIVSAAAFTFGALAFTLATLAAAGGRHQVGLAVSAAVAGAATVTLAVITFLLHRSPRQ